MQAVLTKKTNHEDTGAFKEGKKYLLFNMHLSHSICLEIITPGNVFIVFSKYFTRATGAGTN